jgi:hypothetical protein
MWTRPVAMFSTIMTGEDQEHLGIDVEPAPVEQDLDEHEQAEGRESRG